jgi:NADH-quinone oxidoreductase subunit N
MKAIIATTVFGVIMMFAGIMVSNKKSVAAIAAVLFAALLGVNIYDLATAPESELFFNRMLSIDRYSLWFNTLMSGCSLLYILLMGKEIQKVGAHVD